MVFQIVILLLLSIITARLLEKRHKVASIAHAVLFIVVSFIITAGSGWEPFVNLYTNLLGEEYYQTLYDVLNDTELYVTSGLSTILFLEFILFIIVPILSIVTIVEDIREKYKKSRIDNIYYIATPMVTSSYPQKIFKHTENHKYLVLGHLLN